MFREEVKHLEGWCRENNLVFNADKRRWLSTSRGHSPSTLLSASVAAQWREWRTSTGFSPEIFSVEAHRRPSKLE